MPGRGPPRVVVGSGVDGRARQTGTRPEPGKGLRTGRGGGGDAGPSGQMQRERPHQSALHFTRTQSPSFTVMSTRARSSRPVWSSGVMV